VTDCSSGAISNATGIIARGILNGREPATGTIVEGNSLSTTRRSKTDRHDPSAYRCQAGLGSHEGPSSRDVASGGFVRDGTEAQFAPVDISKAEHTKADGSDRQGTAVIADKSPLQHYTRERGRNRLTPRKKCDLEWGWL
jgi:hypothetical protein